MKKVLILALLIGILIVPGSSFQAAPQQAIPTINIVNVVGDLEVTVQTYNFPKEKTFNVYMGKFGTRAIGGVFVGEFESGDGGEIMSTFGIPEELWTEDQISIRLEASPSGYYAYDWFNNNDGNIDVVLGNNGLPVVYPSSYPYSDVVEVDPGVSVTLLGYSFPANDSLTVTIGYFGTRGVGGIPVETIPDTGPTGEFSATFTIPETLKDEPKLSIRLVSNSIGWYAYDWFNNVEGLEPYGPNPHAPTVPTIPKEPAIDWPEDPDPDDEVVYPDGSPWAQVLNVTEGDSVEVRIGNFPTKDRVKITMGKYGTKGVGGIVLSTGYGTTSWGGFTTTFNIPPGLADEEKLEIRFETLDTGFYAYDTFINSTTPDPDDPDAEEPGDNGIVMPTGPTSVDVISVIPGESIVVRVKNFPYPDTVKVKVGPSWTMGIDGTVVNHGHGTGQYGDFTTTFNIPPGLADHEYLAIRLESNNTYVVAYDIFLNE